MNIQAYELYIYFFQEGWLLYEYSRLLNQTTEYSNAISPWFSVENWSLKTSHKEPV